MSRAAPGTAPPAGHVVVSRGAYVAVFAMLLLLTGATVVVALYDLGPWNTPIALMIALLKATLVILYFMHVRHAPRLVWIVAAAAFLWLAILIAGTLDDYLTRPWLSMPSF